MTLSVYPHTEEPISAEFPDNRALLHTADRFAQRHIGPREADIQAMLDTLGLPSLDALIAEAVPSQIRFDHPLTLEPPRSEAELLADLTTLANQNKVYRSFIGMGYADTITPPVILRNVMENPGWYTAYTPYQAEIAQGRMEALVNFQTMIADLTGMEIANASLLDEATAAAEAMTLSQRAMPRKSKANTFFVSDLCHPQTIAVVQTRAEPLGINVVVGDHRDYDFSEPTFGVLVQYPATNGDVFDYSDFAAAAHEAGALVTVAADLLALTLLRAPGEFGADVVVGNSQRFGVPLGYGGPHAAFMATSNAHKRIMPGRLIGVSVDSSGKPAYRLALQTREQHIRRDKATSNICTAQVLLAVMASMYAVYHGPTGLRKIAQRVQLLTAILAEELRSLGYTLNEETVFDTLTVTDGPRSQSELISAGLSHHINLRAYDSGAVGVALDETVTLDDLRALIGVFGGDMELDFGAVADRIDLTLPEDLGRDTDFLTHPVFNSYHSETEMLRYIYRLQAKDVSLVHSMIPLGSCTMKLNATAEMIPVTLPGFSRIHPFAPLDQTKGYQELFARLEGWLSEITGFSAVSLQPNSGAQGEYAGMLAIRAYHLDHGNDHREICLIPSSAHGTNPASAVMAGMKVVVVACDENGNIDVDDMRAKAEKYSETLAATMITYPSTHGVYEESIKELCQIVHDHGGLVYMDGANMNAQVGFTSPAEIGADVCHLNLHKTFAIPHGGGGPGMGPIGVVERLVPYLPSHPVVAGVGGEKAFGTVSAAPWSSASILPISYAYISMLGDTGVAHATEVAILNANYIAEQLEPHFPVLYRGSNGRVAHECIIELRHLKAHVTVDDVAKRLMDFGFHAPTMSFPVPGTLMIEPTESESKEELDRFCEAMIAIREEIRAIENDEIAHEDSPLAHAPHTAEIVLADEWDRAYSREQAAYPLPWVRDNKYWPPVGRVDNVYGDRNLFCACIPVSDYE